MKIDIEHRWPKWVLSIDGDVVVRASSLKKLKRMVEITDTIRNWENLKGTL